MQILRALVLGAALLAQSLPAIKPAHAATADPALVARGEYLTRAGDCVSCHIAPGGKPFAGGLALPTPVGTIYTPNITPDKETGIGDWSDDAFYKAMHEGIGPNGEYLYPAFPFPWYTKVAHDDVVAIRAYLSSVPAISQANRKPDLAFPFNQRETLLAWRTAFFKPATFEADPAKSEAINRGAYLVEGLGHCGECHNRRNYLGASVWSGRLDGGTVDGWYAPALTAKGHAGVGQWSEAEIVTFLKKGVAPGGGVVVGPMKQTVQESLSHLSDDDLHAIAVYLKSVPADGNNEQPVKTVGASPAADSPGAQAYLSHCAFCHGVDGQGRAGEIPSLVNNLVVTAKGPEDLVRVILGGLPASHGLAPMPAVGAGMTDQQVAEVADYVRQTWGNVAPPTAQAGLAGNLRGRTTTLMAANLASGCPAVADPTLSKAVNQPAVADLLKETSQATLLARVEAAVTKVRAAAPSANADDIVNAMTIAYCPTVTKTPQPPLSEAARAERLGNFSQLVYGAVHSNGRLN